jgi:hypothetical protein
MAKRFTINQTFHEREKGIISFRLFGISMTQCASPENNRQCEQDDCDRHERRAGDVSEQDEDDRDDGEVVAML